MVLSLAKVAKLFFKGISGVQGKTLHAPASFVDAYFQPCLAD